jgi:hypothetical protein
MTTLPRDPAPVEEWPRALSAFIIEHAKVEEEPSVLFRHYTLLCGHCRNDRFALLQRRRNSIDAIGDAIVGLSLRCSQCGTSKSVFDARTDGYDGVLGHNESLAGTSREEPLAGPEGAELAAVRVRATLSFNGDDYLAVAEEDGIPAVDLFDWFEMFALLNDEWSAVWDYECA